MAKNLMSKSTVRAAAYDRYRVDWRESPALVFRYNENEPPPKAFGYRGIPWPQRLGSTVLQRSDMGSARYAQPGSNQSVEIEEKSGAWEVRFDGSNEPDNFFTKKAAKDYVRRRFPGPLELDWTRSASEKIGLAAQYDRHNINWGQSPRLVARFQEGKPPRGGTDLAELEQRHVDLMESQDLADNAEAAEIEERLLSIEELLEQKKELRPPKKRKAPRMSKSTGLAAKYTRYRKDWKKSPRLVARFKKGKLPPRS